MEVFSQLIGFRVVVCRECGLPFGIPHTYFTALKAEDRDGGVFCPNGHWQSVKERDEPTSRG